MNLDEVSSQAFQLRIDKTSQKDWVSFLEIMSFGKVLYFLVYFLYAGMFYPYFNEIYYCIKKNVLGCLSGVFIEDTNCRMRLQQCSKSNTFLFFFFFFLNA